MEEIANLFEGSANEEVENDEQIPEENGINNLLQEMLQNLGQMNNQMNQKVVEEEEEEEEEYTNSKEYYQINSKHMEMHFMTPIIKYPRKIERRKIYLISLEY
jgi:hypothetical protein